MDRRRRLAKLVQLKTMQHLQLGEARVSLADAIDDLQVAGERIRDSARELDLREREFDAVLGGMVFDPDAMRRAGHAIMIAEDGLAETREDEARAQRVESDMRIGWHHERLRLAGIERRRRDAERKSAQIKEDKAGIDALALGAERERLS